MRDGRENFVNNLAAHQAARAAANGVASGAAGHGVQQVAASIAAEPAAQQLTIQQPVNISAAVVSLAAAPVTQEHAIQPPAVVSPAINSPANTKNAGGKNTGTKKYGGFPSCADPIWTHSFIAIGSIDKIVVGVPDSNSVSVGCDMDDAAAAVAPTTAALTACTPAAIGDDQAGPTATQTSFTMTTVQLYTDFDGDNDDAAVKSTLNKFLEYVVMLAYIAEHVASYPAAVNKFNAKLSSVRAEHRGCCDSVKMHGGTGAQCVVTQIMARERPVDPVLPAEAKAPVPGRSAVCDGPAGVKLHAIDSARWVQHSLRSI
ncbi:hypothetical protein H9P43_003659 [Blastocladiella emersonii ATCC 22665]|nr:hypothetical protein H9P43_003659 [Blastocladiella emersonii ATCC 22665]